MIEMNYDDGLVHDHGWATQPPLGQRDTMAAQDAGPEYDDGLVHEHRWACTERGAQTHS